MRACVRGCVSADSVRGRLSVLPFGQHVSPNVCGDVSLSLSLAHFEEIFFSTRHSPWERDRE